MIDALSDAMPWVFGASIAVAVATAAWIRWFDGADEDDAPFEPHGDAGPWPRRPMHDEHPTL